MSKFSGKCDLYDHIAGLGGWYDQDGNSIKFGDSKINTYYSDELQDFIAFKRRTNGILRQHKRIEVTPYNYTEVEQLTEGRFKAIPHTKIVEDKRLKTGQRTDIQYSYIYWDKEYKNLKELNKHGVYITIKIFFNTLLDLIPYYPYIVTACSFTEGKEIVIISNESFVDEEFDRGLKYGVCSSMWQRYKQELQKHYINICKNYFLYKLEERTCIIPILGVQPYDEEYYILYADNNIDSFHDLKFVWKNNKNKPHWADPKLLSGNMILINKKDIDYYLKEDIANNNVQLRYIKTCTFPKEID